MSASNPPRAVIVTRETEYELLLARHATRNQAAFVLRQRNQSLDEVYARHLRQQSVLADVRAGIPRDWRIARVRRAELDRFIFAPEDVVLAVGQDGLVANAAKYLTGQPVLGINPEPERNPGYWCRTRPPRHCNCCSLPPPVARRSNTAPCCARSWRTDNIFWR